MQLFHQPDRHVEMEVPLAPVDVVERIRSQAVEVRSVVWSPAFGATAPFVAEVESARRVRMRVRHGYSNGYTRVLEIEIAPRPGGSRLSCRFHSIRWVEAIMIGVWILLIAPMVILAAQGVTGVAAAAGWNALTLSLLVGIEWFGRRLGDRDERTLAAFLSGSLGGGGETPVQP